MATARAGPYSRILGTLETRIWGVARTRWGKVMSARGPGPDPYPVSQQILDNRAIVHELLILEHWITNDRWRIDWQNSLGRLPGWHSMMSWLIANSQNTSPPPFYSTLFATDDYIQIPDAPSIRFTTAFTIEFWMKHTTGTTSGHSETPLAKWHLEGERSYMIRLDATDRLTAFTSVDGTTISYWTTTNPVLNDTDWHHYRITYNATTITCTKDGTNIPGAGPVATSIFNTIEPLCLGAQGAAYYFLNATLAQVRMWNIVTAPDRFQPFYGPTTGLVLEFPFLPGAGQFTEDYSATENTGRLGSSPDPDTHDPTWTIPTDNPAYTPVPIVSFLLEANHIPKSLGPAYMPVITPAAPAHQTLTITWDPTSSGPYCSPTDPLRGFLCRTTTPGTLIAHAHMIPDGIKRSDATYTFAALPHSPYWFLIACWFSNAGPPTRYSPVAYKQALTT